MLKPDNVYYFYLVDQDFGLFFIKFSGYSGSHSITM